MQENFEYTDQNMLRLERAISAERLRPYLIAARGDRWVALHLYVRNTELSEALYGVVQGIEVLLRNATHSSLSKGFGADHWYENASLRDFERSDIEEARAKIEGRMVPVTPGRMVAELSFGFWVNLYGNYYEVDLWVKHLKTLFPARIARKTVHQRLSELKLLRNRIAHHETLIRRRVDEDYASLMETAGWISPTTRGWIASMNCFQERYARRIPKKPQMNA